ncbi:MAG TPA: hypothetical protein EYP14_06375 [Planctomycetaceae bacterium]|nr:hypothetical protein [Planctomycetaceae bacterium]
MYVYHEPNGRGYAYFDVSKRAEPAVFHRRMCETLVRALKDKGISASVLDAKDWLAICRQRKLCVVVDMCQYPHESLYRGQDEGSPIEQWLDAGGVMVYSGDWPFHWYVKADGELDSRGAGQQGDDDIFDVDLVKDGFVGVEVAPTDAARKWIPSLHAGRTLRPFDAEAVKQHCPWYEFYLRGKRGARTAADALAFRMPHGKGLFVAFHLRRGSHTDSNQAIFEFITNRLPAVLKGAAR